MKIYLRDRNQPLVDQWQEMFVDCRDVHISCGDIFGAGEHLNCEAIVSPANSFGHMDGGIDYAYSDYFGWPIGELLRSELSLNYHGELLVGQAALIDMRKTNPTDPQIVERINRTPYLISAPTMRIPSVVDNTVNAYLAFVAALRVAKRHNIKSIVCPGLGTSIGRMPNDICAIQMFEAYQRHDNPKAYDFLGDASIAHHDMLNSTMYRKKLRSN